VCVCACARACVCRGGHVRGVAGREKSQDIHTQLGCHSEDTNFCTFLWEKTKKHIKSYAKLKLSYIKAPYQTVKYKQKQCRNYHRPLNTVILLWKNRRSNHQIWRRNSCTRQIKVSHRR